MLGHAEPGQADALARQFHRDYPTLQSFSRPRPAYSWETQELMAAAEVTGAVALWFQR